jgi:hypothetical protein
VFVVPISREVQSAFGVFTPVRSNRVGKRPTKVKVFNSLPPTEKFRNAVYLRKVNFFLFPDEYIKWTDGPARQAESDTIGIPQRGHFMNNGKCLKDTNRSLKDNAAVEIERGIRARIPNELWPLIAHCYKFTVGALTIIAIVYILTGFKYSSYVPSVPQSVRACQK